MLETIFLGCAGWSLRKEQFALFPTIGSHLERYASRFNCVEINSSFYKSHRVATYQRWAAATPRDFRFAVKLPKTITHLDRLRDSQDNITQFAAEVAGLGSKLGVVLVQLPPSLEFEANLVSTFLTQLKARCPAQVVIEPRHASWFDDEVGSVLIDRSVGRVAADPAVTAGAREPIIADGLAYFRWHGTPRVYYSSYDDATLMELGQRLVSAVASAEVWCVFDNTAEGAATINALSIQTHLSHVFTSGGTDATH